MPKTKWPKIVAISVVYPRSTPPRVVERRLEQLPFRQQTHMREFFRVIYAHLRRASSHSPERVTVISRRQLSGLLGSDPRSIDAWVSRARLLGLIEVHIQEEWQQQDPCDHEI